MGIRCSIPAGAVQEKDAKSLQMAREPRPRNVKTASYWTVCYEQRLYIIPQIHKLYRILKLFSHILMSEKSDGLALARAAAALRNILGLHPD